MNPPWVHSCAASRAIILTDLADLAHNAHTHAHTHLACMLELLVCSVLRAPPYGLLPLHGRTLHLLTPESLGLL